MGGDVGDGEGAGGQEGLGVDLKHRDTSFLELSLGINRYFHF